MAEKFVFLEPRKLVDGDLELVLVKTSPANIEKKFVPAYFFEMRNSFSNKIMGRIDLRIGYNENIKYGGNVGYEVDEQCRGHQYAARSLKLLFTLAKEHGVAELLVTCNPENIASRKTCERAGGKLVEIVDLPTTNDQYLKGERKKCCYKFAI